MKTKKKLIIILAGLSLLLCILTVKNTYAKYLSVATSTTSMSVARWKILVNSQDIRSNSNISQVITPVWQENPHINNSIIAPNSEGYFEMVIDYTDADVSFTYDIAVRPNPTSSVQDLIATGYSINGNSTIYPLTRTQNIIGTVLQTDTQRTLTLKVYIKWDDSENETMDNSQDTAATNSENPAKLDVNLQFRQLFENNN